MIEVALDTLPYPDAQSLKVLDLGAGTVAFTLEFLKRHSHTKVVPIDGSPSTLELAKARLGKHPQQVKFVMSDFRRIPAALLDPES